MADVDGVVNADVVTIVIDVIDVIWGMTTNGTSTAVVIIPKIIKISRDSNRHAGEHALQIWFRYVDERFLSLIGDENHKRITYRFFLFVFDFSRCMFWKSTKLNWEPFVCYNSEGV